MAKYCKIFIFLLLGFSLAYLFFPFFHGIDRLKFVLRNVFGVNIVSFPSIMILTGDVLAVLFFILAIKTFPIKGKIKVSKETVYLIFLSSISLAVAVIFGHLHYVFAQFSQIKIIAGILVVTSFFYLLALAIPIVGVGSLIAKNIFNINCDISFCFDLGRP